MSLRRPRIKPTAILKPRRPTLQDQNIPDHAESSSTIFTTINDDNSIESTNTVTTSNAIIPKLEFLAIANNEAPNELVVDKPKPTTASSRRLIKPSVVLPVRKKPPVSVVQQKIIDQDDSIIIDQKPSINILASSDFNILVSTDSLSIPSSKSINYEKPIENFKSPFMSPSMQHNNNQRNDQQSGSIVDDIIGAPPSPKIRQRIRPTPCFNRRNSIQGTASDCDEDTNHRRQRHLSTSSSHSTHNTNFISKNVSQIGRIRTESTCSNVSDIVSNIRSTTGLKSKKSTTRTDGLSKVSTVRRDFTHRFNGQTPDKTRLTMFDMIYYNPITNPMKNPAPKSSDIRDRRTSVCSVTSIKSMDSEKSLVKSECFSVNMPMKCELKEETAMPVPQLKLGPDGEIILDEQSLVIETTIGKEARETLANADIVYDDEFSGSKI